MVPRSWEISPTTVGDACRLAIWILGRETLQVCKATGLCKCEICDCFQPSGEDGLAKERSNEHKNMRHCDYVFFKSNHHGPARCSWKLWPPVLRINSMLGFGPVEIFSAYFKDMDFRAKAQGCFTTQIYPGHSFGILMAQCPRTPSLTNVISMAVKR